jgi:hypothetical protein
MRSRSAGNGRYRARQDYENRQLLIANAGDDSAVNMHIQEAAMKLFRIILSAFASLALLVALGLGGYSAITMIARLFSKLDVQFATMTAIASLVILLSAMIVASSIRRTSQQNKANTFQAERAATYRFFTDVWTTLLQPGHELEAQSSIKLAEEQRTLDHLLALYGSPRVIKSHVALRALGHEVGTAHSDVRLQLAQTLLEIRKELGSEAKVLAVADLGQLLFADSSKVSAFAKTNAYEDGRPLVSLASHF